MIRRTYLIILALLTSIGLPAQKWTFHMAYNHVTRIAMSEDRVYATSDGSLYSVDKQTEKIQTYANLSGTDITCIYYDQKGAQLIIGYGNGKIDMMDEQGVHYIPGLYEKDMTQRKTINNITIDGRIAFLSTPYGVQTMNLNERKLVDSYWLRPGGQETEIIDIVVDNDSIYAFTADSLFCASKKNNIVDYTFWTREPRNGRIEPDRDKGLHYKDLGSDWYAGGEEGIVRVMATERTTYKPQGPLNNNPYRLRYAAGKLAMVNGGYDAGFYNRPGVMVTYEEGKWQNYDNTYMTSRIDKSEDYCDVAIDPTDPSHFFVASFGYGLIEFRKDTFYHQYLPSNTENGLESLTSNEKKYTWVDGLVFDADGNLWMLNISHNGVKVLLRDSTWGRISNVATQDRNRTKELLIWNQNPHIKVLSDMRVTPGIGIFNDNGTIADESDDQAVFVSSFTTENGTIIQPEYITALCQTSSGKILVGTDKGFFVFDNPERLLYGNDTCHTISDLADERILCFAEDASRRIWVGTELSGLYCFSEDLQTIEMQYDASNAPLPSSTILSLCAVPQSSILFIGTSAGLLELDYDDPGPEEKIQWEKEESSSIGTMKNWKTHFSYNNISLIEDAGEKTFCVANGSLMGVNKKTDEIKPISKLDGLSGANITLVGYNRETRKTVLVYQNGQIDILTAQGDIQSMSDLFLSTETRPSEFYSTYSYGTDVYISSSIGIIRLNTRKNEISETYILMKDDKELQTHHVCIIGDSIYAATESAIYSAPLNSNLIDYATWKPIYTPFNHSISSIGTKNDDLYAYADSSLYYRHNNQWAQLMPTYQWVNVFIHSQSSVIAQTTDGLIFEFDGASGSQLPISGTLNDIVRSGQDIWFAVPEYGLQKWNGTDGTQQFALNTPCSNFSYRIRIKDDKLFMLPGGYLAANYFRPGHVMVRENGFWRNYTHQHLESVTSTHYTADICDAAVDPNNPSHFFASSFGFGLLEFRNNEFHKQYLPKNTINGLEAVIEPEEGFTWVDGLVYDTDGNLWMLNKSYNGVKVLLKNGSWVRISNVATRDRNRTKELLIWNQNPNIKILADARETPGIGVFNDNGTIAYTGDDKAVFYSSFVDQNGKTIQPQYVYSLCQMANGEIWVGTESGLFIIEDVQQLLNHKNQCKRIIIPRNDGTGLGDYLLGNEMINCITEDAAGRKWIGTETSGLYLVSADGLETIEHFTKYNSPLVSDGIYCLAIEPKTGELYVGTSIGLLSYQSDANEAQEDMKNIYAYPNPVRPNYQGYISITGLMDNTEVRIVDAGGNLVCKTRSNGGLAIWDGKDGYGKRVRPGVYTALCNAKGGHNVCKILVMHETR